jgi:hypothetical protein
MKKRFGIYVINEKESGFTLEQMGIEDEKNIAEKRAKGISKNLVTNECVTVLPIFFRVTVLPIFFRDEDYD